MGVTAVNQTWADEGVDEDENGKLNLTLGYQFIADSPINSTLELLQDSRFPRRGRVHPENPNLIALRRRNTRISESREVAEGEVVFSTRLGAAAKLGVGQRDYPEVTDELNDDPLKDKPVIEWIPIEGTRVAESGRLKDNTTGQFANAYTPITNSAGMPYYDPPVEVRASQWQVLYRRNELNPNPIILEYQDVVNEDDITVGGINIPAGNALLAGARIGASDYRGGKVYVPITYDIRLKLWFSPRTGEGFLFKGWEIDLQDRGYHYLNDSGDLVRAVDDENNDTVEPVFLDGTGKKADSPAASPARTYKVYFEKPFNIFNFK